MDVLGPTAAIAAGVPFGRTAMQGKDPTKRAGALTARFHSANRRANASLTAYMKGLRQQEESAAAAHPGFLSARVYRTAVPTSYYWKPRPEHAAHIAPLSVDDDGDRGRAALSRASPTASPTIGRPRPPDKPANKGSRSFNSVTRDARIRMQLNIPLSKEVATALIKSADERAAQAAKIVSTGFRPLGERQEQGKFGLMSAKSLLEKTIDARKSKSKFRVASTGERAEPAAQPTAQKSATEGTKSPKLSPRKMLKLNTSKWIEDLKAPFSGNEEEQIAHDRAVASKTRHLEEAQVHLQEVTESYNDYVIENKKRADRLARMEKQFGMYERIIGQVKHEIRTNDPEDRVKAAKEADAAMDDELFAITAYNSTLKHIHTRTILDIRRLLGQIREANAELASATSRIGKGEEEAVRMQNRWTDDKRRSQTKVQASKARTAEHRRSVGWLKNEYEADASFWRMREVRKKDEELIRDRVQNNLNLNSAKRIRRDAARSTWKEAQANEEKERLRALELQYRKMVMTIMNSIGLKTPEEVLTLLNDPDKKSRETQQERVVAEARVKGLEEELKAETDEMEKQQLMGLGRISVATTAYDKPMSQANARINEVRMMLRRLDGQNKSCVDWLNELRGQLQALTDPDVASKPAATPKAAEASTDPATETAVPAEGEEGGEEISGGGGAAAEGGEAAADGAARSEDMCSEVDATIRDLDGMFATIVQSRASVSGMGTDAGEGIGGPKAWKRATTMRMSLKLKMLGSFGKSRNDRSITRDEDVLNFTRELSSNNNRVDTNVMEAYNELLAKRQEEEEALEEASAAADGETITREEHLEILEKANSPKRGKKGDSPKRPKAYLSREPTLRKQSARGVRFQ